MSNDQPRAADASAAVTPRTLAPNAILALVVLHISMPLAIIVPTPFSYTGLAVAAAGVAMVAWARRAFQAAGTPIRPLTESTALVRHGLYRWTRNPMYVGAVLLVAGVAILLGSLTPWLVVVAYAAILQEGFIRREEQLLEQRFGEEYREYKRRVRRWL